LSGEVDLVPTETWPDPEEIALVHLGNNPLHLWLLGRLRAPGTVAVLHDLVLHHLAVEATAAEDAGESLGTMLERAHGAQGVALARARAFGITGARDPFLFPARAAFVTANLGGVVVHSRWAEQRMLLEFPDLPCGRIGLPAADPGSVNRSRLRDEMGWSPDEVVLMHIGFMTPEKGVHEVLGGLAAARSCGVNARLVLVGEGRGFDTIRSVAADLGLGGHVSCTGWVESADFPQLPSAADLGVVLRTPTAGETSAAAVRFLACGTPVAVVGVRQFLELPESAAPRITPGASAAADVARLLACVQSRSEGWADRRRAARAAYDAAHRPEDAAEGLLEFLRSVANS
jgi:glycosyltransferase involved in cell wall biosynthesis